MWSTCQHSSIQETSTVVSLWSSSNRKQVVLSNWRLFFEVTLDFCLLLDVTHWNLWYNEEPLPSVFNITFKNTSWRFTTMSFVSLWFVIIKFRSFHNLDMRLLGWAKHKLFPQILQRSFIYSTNKIPGLCFMQACIRLHSQQIRCCNEAQQGCAAEASKMMMMRTAVTKKLSWAQPRSEVCSKSWRWLHWQALEYGAFLKISQNAVFLLQLQIGCECSLGPYSCVISVNGHVFISSYLLKPVSSNVIFFPQYLILLRDHIKVSCGAHEFSSHMEKRLSLKFKTNFLLATMMLDFALCSVGNILSRSPILSAHIIVIFPLQM